MLQQFSDQQLSFCDCTSFAMSSHHKVDFVFGFDEHFRTGGFDLRPGPA